MNRSESDIGKKSTTRQAAEAAPMGHKGLGRYVSLLEGIRPYQRNLLPRDILAGITLAALAIPEVMGYTKISGTPVITGLYTILLPAIAFAIFGSSRHLVVGGDSATAAILYAGIAGLGISGLQPGSAHWLGYASLAALITGAMLIIARVARLGFLADFISRTVLVGFLTGVGVQVAMGQLAGMLGVASPSVKAGRISGTLIKFWDTVKAVPHPSLTTIAVTVGVIATLVIFQKWIKAVPGGLVAVVGAIAVSRIFDLKSHGVAILGLVPSGLPPIGPPKGVGWHEVVPLLATCASLVLVILAQSAATSRAYAVKYRDRFSENTDLIGLSLANIVAGFSATFVVNGSPTKTEMADEARSRSQVAMLAMAATVAVVLLFLTPALRYLPAAVLSAVVFVIGVKLIDVSRMREIARLRRVEFYIAAVTAVIVVVVGVEQGILLAMVLSVVDHLRRHYDPHDSVITLDQRGAMTQVAVTPGAATEPGLVVYRFGVGLFYANAARLTDEVMVLVDVADPPRWFVLLADSIDDIDFTGGETLLELAKQLTGRSVVFAIAEATLAVRPQLDRFGVTAAIGADHIYETVADAIRAFEGN